MTPELFIALLAATMNGHVEIVRLLLKKGADPRLKGRFNNLETTAMDVAKKMGRREMIRVLKSAQKNQS
jgi:ankyrin repeat protein